MKSIYADFMKIDNEGRLVLTCLGTHKDLEKHNTSLKDGLKLVFYNDDEDDNGNPDNLVVGGIVEYDNNKERWIANINWDEIKNISKLSVEEKQKLGVE
jgi:hypothetical protein